MTMQHVPNNTWILELETNSIKTALIHLINSTLNRTYFRCCYVFIMIDVKVDRPSEGAKGTDDYKGCFYLNCSPVHCYIVITGLSTQIQNISSFSCRH